MQETLFPLVLSILPAVLDALPWVSSGLSRTIGSHPWSILLILIGVGTVGLGIFGVVQTRRWPKTVHNTRHEPPERPAEPPKKTPAAAKTPPPAPAKPMQNTDQVTIDLPQIHERHPDVWDHKASLDVEIQVSPKVLERLAKENATPECRLLVHQGGRTEEAARPALKEGMAKLRVNPTGKGEARLHVRVGTGDRVLAENARSVRFVDYRSEVVETFEDFEKWAHTHYPLPRRTLTAREFVDHYADLVVGTPIEPLDRIVDIYEMSNFSDHSVDREAYLQLVDAFLELEDAGALEGPAETEGGT